MKYKIDEFIIGGIKRPLITVRGKKNNSLSLMVIVDGKKYNLIENQSLGRDYVVDKIEKNIRFEKFVASTTIPKNCKKVQLYVIDKKNKELILTKNTSTIKRIFSRIIYSFISFPNKFKRFLNIIKKIWKTLLKHRFIITPALFKRYINSLKNNMGSNNVEDYFFDPLNQDDYLKWLEENNEKIQYKNFKYNPKISIIVPVYNVDSIYLEECINSVLNQVYNNFELILVDDCSTKVETINTLKKYESNDKIKVIYREKNGHISEATNSGIESSTGEFISLLDNDDVLDKNALYYVVQALNNDKSIDMIYSDEDKIYFNNAFYFPHFKPDYSPDTLLSSNYICHFTTIRKTIVNEIGGFRSLYNGSQDYDLFLRVTEKTNKIYHIPKILYHWRMIPSSTASSGDSKNYAYIAGKKALEDALKRRNIKANVNLIGIPQMYDIDYLYDDEPKISIIIPTKDKAEMLDKCLKSIYNNTSYKNYEIIVISNNSCEEKTFNLLNKYKESYENFRFIEINCEFNYSYINNEAVKVATGDYIVFLNNDIEIKSNNWLSKMVGYAMQSHIGCVGIKLLYPTKTIQHAGVVIGGGGIAAHGFIGTGDDNYGYFGRLVANYDYSAVTAACLMINRLKFDEVNGFDEKLKVAYNDVDLNLKILDKGYYNVLLPSVKAIHYESISRGNDFDEKNIKRFASEIDYMINKWGDSLLHDRFYNDNLSYYYPFHLDKKGEYDE